MKEASAYDDLIYKLVFLDSDEDKEKVYRLINHVIRETWNEALDKAAESAEVKAYYKHRHKGSRYKEWKDGDDVDLFETTQMYKLDKQSILKLKL